MKIALVATLLSVAVLANGERDYEAMFREFKATHLKAYANVAEESERKAIFIENMKKAEYHQARNPLAEFGVNAYADMSAAEFKSRHNAEKLFQASALRPRHNEYLLTETRRKAAAGQKVDWREKGAITPVKNQGSCGSCWSFSATGNIESAWFLAGNPLTSVSEQELVSCDTTDSGCGGGLETQAWAWLLKNRKGEIVTEEALPYKSGSGSNGVCPSNLNSLTVGAVINDYTNIQASEDAMAAYCFANGAVSIGVDATSWQSYRSGILTNCISRAMDHSVLIVGYDDTNVPPYWIIKNSWGQSWGEQGYIRVAKGSNQCLLKNDASAAIVSNSSSVRL